MDSASRAKNIQNRTVVPQPPLAGDSQALVVQQLQAALSALQVRYKL